MNDARRSRTTAAGHVPTHPAGRRTGVISGLLLVLPLVLGARDCERDAQDDGDECDAGDCGPNGQAGSGGTEAGAGAGTGGTSGGDGAGRGGSGDRDGCLYDGERHDVGDSFPSDDGCNTCTCTAGGMVACTLRACAPGGRGGSAGTSGGSGGSSGSGGSAGEAGDPGGSGTGGQSGSGQTCGGFAALECNDADEFCNYEESAGGQGCDGTISDAGGRCLERPQICTQQFDPVCSCDRRTYGNACGAHSAGASVLHDGQCTEVDCAAIGGHPVDGLGPAPVCPSGETDHGSIAYSNGMIAIEGTICCVP